MKFIDLLIRIMAMVVIPAGIIIAVKTNIEIIRREFIWKK